MEKGREKIFLTSTEASQMLNISKATLLKYISLGKVKTIRTPGGHYRIPRAELLASLYEQWPDNQTRMML